MFVLKMETKAYIYSFITKLSMKNSKNLVLIAIILAFGSTQTTAQIQISADLFTKTWKVDFDEDRYIRNMSDDEWNSFKKLTTTQRHQLVSSLKQEASSTTFEFKANRNFIVRKSGEILEEGKWELQSDGKTIIARNDKGFEDLIELLELNQDKLVINSQQYGQELILLPLKQPENQVNK